MRAVAALDCRLGLEYDSLRKAVLEAYGSVPEAYRLRFRELRRQPGETYLDFWRNQEIAIDRWLNSWEAFDYLELRALPYVHTRSDQSVKDALVAHKVSLRIFLFALVAQVAHDVQFNYADAFKGAVCV